MNTISLCRRCWEAGSWSPRLSWGTPGQSLSLPLPCPAKSAHAHRSKNTEVHGKMEDALLHTHRLEFGEALLLVHAKVNECHMTFPCLGVKELPVWNKERFGKKLGAAQSILKYLFSKSNHFWDAGKKLKISLELHCSFQYCTSWYPVWINVN